MVLKMELSQKAVSNLGGSGYVVMMTNGLFYTWFIFFLKEVAVVKKLSRDGRDH